MERDAALERASGAEHRHAIEQRKRLIAEAERDAEAGQRIAAQKRHKKLAAALADAGARQCAAVEAVREATRDEVLRQAAVEQKLALRQARQRESDAKKLMMAAEREASACVEAIRALWHACRCRGSAMACPSSLSLPGGVVCNVQMCSRFRAYVWVQCVLLV